MLLEPPIDALIKKVGSPYKLAVLAGKRAKYLSTVLTTEELEKKHPVTRAVEEINTGVIV